MPSVVLGLRHLLPPTAVLLLSLFVIRHFQSAWQPFEHIIVQLPYWLFAAVFLMAAQFNRSRLAVLTLLLAIFYATRQGALFDRVFLSRFSDFAFLGGALFITALLFIKDRALFSVYGLNRAALAVICLIVAWAWLWSFQLWVQPGALKIFPNQSLLIPLLKLDVLIGLLVLIQLMMTTTRPSITSTALFLTMIIWMLHYYLPDFVVLPILFSVAGIFLLLSILFDFYCLAYRDELTGLPSRRALNQLGLSLGSHYSVAMLDVDHFKKFNDTHGHDVGDQVLKLVATFLRKVKGGGKVFRYGGEEFTIVFPRKDAHTAIAYLEDIRRLIAHYKMVLREDKRKSKNKHYRRSEKPARTPTVSVTISIGVADKEPGQTFEQTIKAADEALYRAKQQGRNRVCQ